MATPTATFRVRPRGAVAVLDIEGELTPACEVDLDAGWRAAAENGARTIVLNFSGLTYMNSGGIGLLVTLLVRANRQGQTLAAYGLDQHYRQIFELTRLDEAIAIHATEQDAVTTAGG
jgi:anti-sigma B factor antagonist